MMIGLLIAVRGRFQGREAVNTCGCRGRFPQGQGVKDRGEFLVATVGRSGDEERRGDAGDVIDDKLAEEAQLSQIKG